MTYLVYIGMTVVEAGPHPEATNSLIGIVNAKSIREAAKILGAQRWHGWKKVPGVNVSNWQIQERKFHFLKLECQMVDDRPENAKGNAWLQTVRIKKVPELTGNIPKWMP